MRAAIVRLDKGWDAWTAYRHLFHWCQKNRPDIREYPWAPVWLDSTNGQFEEGRYSIMGWEPFAWVTLENGRGVEGFCRQGQVQVKYGAHSLLAAADRWLSEYRLEGAAWPLPFVSGVMGFLTYEGEGFLACYHQVLVVDHVHGQLWLCCADPWQDEPERIAELWRQRLSSLDLPEIAEVLPAPSRLEMDTSMSATQYQRAVEKARRYIARGEIHQLNLAYAYRTTVPLAEGDASGLLTLLHLYGRLREVSPSAFASFFPHPQGALLSSSPERFLRWRNGWIEARPIKGTRPRGRTPEEDQQLRKELMQSEKERTELLMITDVLRHDLGKICSHGSVTVPHLFRQQAYETLWHQYSVVQGRLRENISFSRIMAATFPGGSITGAPKKRAMEIIAELEGEPRGAYTGSLGYASFHGTGDWNILIRTLLAQPPQGQGISLTFHVGAGIVYSSNAQEEWEETRTKALGILRALKAVWER